MARSVMRMGSPPELVTTDASGKVTELHIGHGHWSVDGTPNHGEFVLCGKAIDYSTFDGFADGAPMCPKCERLDG
jgi:hypothetical protein